MRRDQQKRWRGLKLWQKGLIIILLPLLAEILFLAVLVDLVHRAEIDIRNEYHAKSVAQETALLGNLAIEAAQLMLSSSFITRSNGLDALDSALRDLRRQVDSVHRLQAQDDTEREYLDKISLLSEEGLVYYAHVRLRLSNRSDGLIALSDKHTSTHAQMILHELRAQIQGLTDYENSTNKLDPETAERSRMLVVYCLFGGLAINTCIALGAGAYFYRQFVHRIDAIADNSRRMVDFSELAPVLAGGDEIAYVDEVLHETADKLRATAEKERALSELKQQFVAMVSHDLRTPMASIQGILDLLRVGALGEISERAQSRVNQAIVSCNRLMDLINGLLDMEKLESGKMDLCPTNISVALLIEQSILSVETFAANHGVTLATSPCELEIYADEARLVQVLVNLLSNAIKYSPKGETVHVCVVTDDKTLEIRVADRGRGVPDELKAAIFERFRQVEVTDATQKGGTGLGLAICKAIIELHGGSLGIDDNKEGGITQGSVFWFKVPISPPDDGSEPASIT